MRRSSKRLILVLTLEAADLVRPRKDDEPAGLLLNFNLLADQLRIERPIKLAAHADFAVATDLTRHALPGGDLGFWLTGSRLAHQTTHGQDDAFFDDAGQFLDQPGPAPQE